MSDSSSNSSAWVGPGVLLVLTTAIVSGVSTFVNASAVQGTGSDAFVTARNVVVALLLVPFAVVVGRPHRSTLGRKDWARLVAIGLVGGAIPFLLFFHGLSIAAQAGATTTASFLYRSLFLMATVLGLIVLGERFHRRVALAAALLLGGNLLLLSVTSPVLSDGDAYVLAATALWAVEYTISKRALRDLSASTVALGRMGFGSVFLSGYLLLTAQAGTLATFTSVQWQWVAISALLLTAFVATWYAGLRRVDLGVATSVLVVGYPITWLLSVVVRSSAFTPAEAIGAAVVAAGGVLALGWTALERTGRYLRTVAARPDPLGR